MKTVQTIMLTVLIAFGLACGYSSNKTTTPAQPGTAPALSQLVPNATNSGGPAFVLTVNGDNFASRAVINFNGAAQATTFVTAKQLTATIPASAIATAGMVNVSVTNPGTPGGQYGGGTLPANSNNMTFTIN